MLTNKDENNLVKKVNTLLADYHARVMFKEVPKSICDFFEKNAELVNGAVVIVRSKSDESMAAHARNTKDKVLFVFSDEYYITSYFSGVCQNIKLSKALLKRAADF